jgi:hypothetical protein
LLICITDCDPIRRSGVKTTSPDYTVLDPVVDNIRIDSKLFRHLLDGQFLRVLQLGGGDLVAMADPPDHRNGERFA